MSDGELKLPTVAADYNAFTWAESSSINWRNYASEATAKIVIEDAAAMSFDDRRQFITDIGVEGLGRLAKSLPHDSKGQVPALSGLLDQAEALNLWPVYQRIAAIQAHAPGFKPQPGDEGLKAVAAAYAKVSIDEAKKLELAGAMLNGGPIAAPSGLKFAHISAAYEFASTISESTLRFDEIGKHHEFDGSELAVMSSSLSARDVTSFANTLTHEQREVFAEEVNAHPNTAVAFWNGWVRSQPDEARQALEGGLLREPALLSALAGASERWPVEARDAFMLAYAQESIYGDQTAGLNLAVFAAWFENQARLRPDEAERLCDMLVSPEGVGADGLAMLLLELEPGHRKQLIKAVTSQLPPDEVAEFLQVADRNKIETIKLGRDEVPAIRAALNWGLRLAENPDGPGMKIIGASGPAKLMKLHPGDTILSIDGVEASNVEAVRDHLFHRRAPTDKLSVQYECRQPEGLPGTITVDLRAGR